MHDTPVPLSARVFLFLADAMPTDWRVIAELLYLPLKSSPCRCTHHWDKGILTRTKHCSRCVALEAYDAAGRMEA